jgi:hypothetical protein
MIWVKAICGRLELSFRYSKDIVYNNFPWPETTDQEKLNIEIAAEMVLNVRKFYKDKSFAELYNAVNMPDELREAHHNLDRIVTASYKFEINELTEAKILATLMERYQKLTSL